MRTIVRNVFSNWAGVIVNMAVAFLLSPFLVHSLGNSGYGLWVLVLSVTGYMGLLDSGLRVSIVKHTAKFNARDDSNGINNILFTGLSLYGSLSLVVIVLGALASAWFAALFNLPVEEVPTGRLLMFLAAVNIALSLPLGVFGGLLAGLQRYDLVNKVGIIVLLVRSAAIVAAVSMGFRMIGLAWIHVASQVLTGMLLLAAARRQFPALDLKPRRPDGATVKALYRYSGYIVLNNVAMLLLFSSGEVLIGMFIGTAAVTFYAIARSLIQYLSTFIGSMTQVFHPYASDQHERGNAHAVGEALILGTKTSLLIALPIGVSFVLVGSTFIGLWMGPEYGAAAGPLLGLLTVPQLIWLSQSTAGNILLGVGRHRVLTTVNLASGIAGILLGVLLVRRFGAAGVAAGMALPILISQAFILPIYTARALNVPLRDYLVGAYVGPIAAVIPFAAVLYVVSRLWPATHLLTLALQVSCCLTTFAVAAYFFSFTRSQRERWKTRISPVRSLANEVQ